MATRHATREVSIWALCNTPLDGSHFAIVKSGKWPEVVKYLNTRARYAGPSCLFIEQSDGKLSPLFA